MQLTSSRGLSTPSRVLGSLVHRIATLIVTSFAACLSIHAAKCEQTLKSDSAPNIVLILASDIGEQHDLAAEHPERLAELKKYYETWNAAVDADCRKLGIDPPKPAP